MRKFITVLSEDLPENYFKAIALILYHECSKSVTLIHRDDVSLVRYAEQEASQEELKSVREFLDFLYHNDISCVYVDWSSKDTHEAEHNEEDNFLT